jgi:hypothetical protein
MNPEVITGSLKTRNKRFGKMVVSKRPLRGSFGPGFTEYGHHASSKQRLRNIRIQNCARSFDMNAGEQRLIKA